MGVNPKFCVRALDGAMCIPAVMGLPPMVRDMTTLDLWTLPMMASISAFEFLISEFKTVENIDTLSILVHTPMYFLL